LSTNGSNIVFTIAYSNTTFTTNSLNSYLDVDSGLNDTFYSSISIENSDHVYTTNATAGVIYDVNTAYNGSAVVACHNYSSTDPGVTTGFVFVKVNLNSIAGPEQTVKVKVEIDVYDSCNTSNFGGSDIWIWIIVIVAVILVILVIIGAVAGFLYWKKKQSGNYALYNDS